MNKRTIRKYFIVLFSVMIIFSPFSIVMNVSLANNTNVEDDYDWEDHGDGTVTITDYKGSETEVVIPESLDGKTVVAIGGKQGGFFPIGAFQEKNLTRVTIPDTVTKIGAYAFSRNKLTEIELPDSVEEVGGYAFSYNELSKVTLSENLEEISNNMFFGNKIQSITLPESITKIGNDSFRENDHLKEVNFTSNLTSIGRQAFSGTSLEEVFIPKSVEYIGDRAFQINGIERLIFEDGRTADLEIASGVFRDNKIQTLTLPERTVEVGIGSFQNNLLEEVQLPLSLESLSLGLFEDNRLEEIELPEGVKTIQYRAFANNLLTNIHIPSSVEDLTSPFHHNPLESITVDGGNAKYKDIGQKGLYSKDGKTLYQGTKAGEVDPNTKLIEASAFRGLGITGTLSLPDGLEDIEHHAFSENKITSVNIPNNLTEIKQDVFSENLLEQISFPGSIETIGVSAFANNKLMELTLPNTIEEIGSSAFANNLLTEFVLPDHFEEVPANLFAGNRIQSIDLPEHITAIGFFAFNNNNLQELIVRGKNQLIIGGNALADDSRADRDLTTWRYPGTEFVVSQNEYTYRELSDEGILLDGPKYQVPFGIETTINIIDADNKVFGKLKVPQSFENDKDFSDLYVKVETASGNYPTGLVEAGLVVDVSFSNYFDDKTKVTGDFDLSLFTDINYPYAEMYHEEATGDWKRIGGSYSNGYITANVEGFSKYGILAEERFDIPVEKVWVGEVGDPVTVNLYKDGVFYDYRTLSESNDWKDSFVGMPFYENGELIDYTVEEENVPENYEVDISGSAEDGFVITNTEIVPEPDYEFIEITVTKEWVGEVGGPVTVYLYNDLGDGEEFQAELSETNGWTHTFYDMYSLYDGKPVNYWLEEEEVDGYETEVTGSAEDGFIITNTEILPEPEPETMDITVTKKWVGTPGDAVEIYLLVNGDRYPEAPVILSADNNWTHVFEAMPVAYDGVPVEYWVTEVEIEGYETDISGSAEEGFVITNTEIVEEPIIEEKDKDEPEEEPEDEAEGETLPKTATNNYNLLLIGSLLLMVGALIIIVLKARRKVL